MSVIEPNENFLALQVNFKSVLGLIDTGAITSCISEQFARFLRLKPVPCKEKIKLISANSSPICSLGTVDIEFSIQGLVIPFTVHVLKSLSHKLILGQDFLQSSNAVINCGDRSITLFEGLVSAALTRYRDRESVLRLTQDVIFPAATETIVKLFVPSYARRKIGLVETFPQLKNKFLVVANAVVHPKGSYTIGRILNTGLTPRRLRAKTPIARISLIDTSDPFNAAMLSIDDEQETCDKETRRTVQMPEHADRLKLLNIKGLTFDNPDLTEEQFSQLTALLYEYQEIFCADYEQLPMSNLPPYEVKLTSNTPIRQKQYPLSPQQEVVMEKIVDKLLQAKIVQPSKSAYNSPALLIRKANFDKNKADDVSQYRLCIDYRSVNYLVCPEYIPLTSLDSACQSISRAGNVRFFSSMDLTSGFYQVPLAEKSREITAFSTRSRHVEFLKMPMGLRTSPTGFLASLYDILRENMGANLSIYMDDCIIFHSNFEEHVSFLGTIFEKLRKAKLRINPRKSLFARNSLVFLGFLFTPEGIRIDPKRFEKIRNLKPARNVKDVKSLIGWAQYWRKFCRGFSHTIGPLRRLLQKDVKFEWGPDQDKALQKLKDALLSDVVLIFPDLNEKFFLQVDASKSALGHSLLQMKDGVLRPVAFGGRSFKQYEQKLSACHSELLAILHAIQTYHQFLANGRPFTILSDHCSLKFIKDLRLSTSPKLVRYSLLLQTFNFDVVHIKGKSNVIADFLSRYPIEEDNKDNGIYKPEPNSIEDVDFFGHLSNIDAEAYVTDSKIEFRDPSKKRRRNYRVYEITPIGEENPSVRQDEQTSRRSRRREQIDRTEAETDNLANNAEQRTEQDADTALLDGETEQMQNNLHSQLAPEINLESQRDDAFFAAVIDYLQNGLLPSDKNTAQRVLFQADDFFIQDDQLWHLARLKNKRLQQISPRFHQLCIPKCFRMKIMQSIHEFSHFSFLKCYLTARQKFYWHSMATEFAMFTKSCLVCQQIRNTAKPHYPLQSIPVSGLFEVLMIDFHEIRQPKRAGKDVFKYVLILIDQMSQFVTLIPTRDMKAETAAQAIMDHFILKFGTFRYLISDRSSSWLNQLFETFLKMPGMQAHHIKTSPYRPQTNSLSELQNKHIIRHLRAYCTDSTNFHEFLPAIAAAINGNVNTALGTSSFFILYGMNYRFPFETALTSNELSFREVWDMPGLESLAKRLEIIRDIVHQNIREARANTERIKNVNAKPHDFQVGDRVFVSAEMDSSRITNRKHSPAFIGPFVLVELKNNLAKLVHFYTGKPLKNFINVDKLKRLRDEPREVLYNRHRPTQQTSSTDNDVLTQRTVQPAVEQRADGAQNSLNAIGAALKLKNDNSPWQALQRAPDETDKVIYIEKSRQAQNINLNETNCTRQQSPQLQSPEQRGRQTDVAQQMKRSDLSPWTSAVRQQLPARSTSRPEYSTGMEINATHGAETPMFSRSVKVLEQQMHRDHNPVATELQETEENLQSMPIVGNNNDSPKTPGSNLTAQSEITHAGPESADVKLCNRTACTEQRALTTHMAPGTNSDPRTFIRNANEALTKTNEDGYSAAAKIKDSIREIDESLDNPLIQAADSTRHTPSTGQRHHSVETEEHCQEQQLKTQDNITSYRRVDLNTTVTHTDDRITKVSARKAAKPHPLYKAHFNDKTKPCWIPVTSIPPEIVAAFHVKCFQRKKTRKLTK
jgi:hypothetical protein